MTRTSTVLALAAMALSSTMAGCGEQGMMILGCDSLGASKDAQKVRAFIDTASQLEADALALEGEVEATCAAMAADLGVEVPMPAEDELQVEATCGAVQAEIEAIVDAALPRGASLTLEYEPPVCSVDVDAYADCVAACDADVAADVTVECSEGRLVGQCSGTCTGECRVEGEVACEAECRGTCTGTCDGTCTGTCDGTCSATDEEGNCVGTCDGTCTGTCSASCTGTCEGTCVSDVEASCEGTCAGTCDVELQEPRCEGMADVDADVDCRAACEASADVQAECTEPSVTVSTDATVDPAAQARLATLVRVLHEHYPRFLGLSARVEAVAASGADLVEAFDAAAAAAERLGVRASACFADATALAVRSVSTVEVTLSVTVEVNASVTAAADG
jgi:hypothetical protein